MLNIVVADDHPIVRSGIRFTLKNHVGQNARILEAENGDQIIEYSKLYKLDMLIMGLNMPNTDPQRIVQTLLVMQPQVKIVILSMNKEVIFGPLYLKLGAKAFVPKELDEEEFVKAIKEVMLDKVYMREDVRDFYKKNINLENPYGQLTKKEIEILCQLIKGEPVAQIAKIMNLGITTISTHKASIFEKLNVSNLLELKAVVDLYPL